MSTITLDLQLSDNYGGLIKAFFKQACHNAMEWPEPQVRLPDITLLNVYRLTHRESAEHQHTNVQLDYPDGCFLYFQHSRLLWQWALLGVVGDEWLERFGIYSGDMRMLLMKLQFPLDND